MSRPALKVVPGRHYDPSQPWARAPRLKTAVELRQPAKAPRMWLRYLTAAALGALVTRMVG